MYIPARCPGSFPLKVPLQSIGLSSASMSFITRLVLNEVKELDEANCGISKEILCHLFTISSSLPPELRPSAERLAMTTDKYAKHTSVPKSTISSASLYTVL